MANNTAFSSTLKLTFACGQNLNEDLAVCADLAGIRLLAAFDGCGGIGGRRYPHLGNHTGAYLASRLYADCLKEWFEKSAAALPRKDTAGELSVLFAQAAREYQARYLNLKTSAITGSMVRTLPSTAAIALVTGQEAALYWGGDTRGYLLTGTGLRQLTADDLTMPCDALDSLYTDAPIANYLCADQPFALHETKVKLPLKGILVLATDGAFHMQPTPMHFESLLLDTLMQSSTQKQWKQLLKENLAACAADDVTLLLQLFGFPTHEKTRLYFDKRQRHVQQAYILPAGEAKPCSRLALRSLWEMYQKE